MAHLEKAVHHAGLWAARHEGEVLVDGRVLCRELSLKKDKLIVVGPHIIYNRYDMYLRKCRILNLWLLCIRLIYNVHCETQNYELLLC